VIVNAGLLKSEQITEALLVTAPEPQALKPFAVTVLAIEQAFVGAIKVVAKLVETPGARELALKMIVLGTGWSLTTVMLVSVMLPVLRIVSLYTTTEPGAIGQSLVTIKFGDVTRGQLAKALLATGAGEQTSLPVAVTDPLSEQVSTGTVKIAAKLAKPPGARLDRLRTVLSWLVTTLTLFRVTVPELVTVPV